MRGYHGMAKTNSNIDTLTVGVLADAVYASAAMDLTLSHIDGLYFDLYNEAAGAADTNQVFVQVILQYAP